MTWTPAKIARIPDSEQGAAVCMGVLCFKREHPATYTIESAQRETGVVKRLPLCTTAAARLAYSLKIDFPPGRAAAAGQFQPRGV